MLTGAFIGLGLIYSLTTPLFEAPDESSHFFFAWSLAQTGSIPVLRAGDPDLWAHEAGQPPLYYLAVAALIHGLDTHDADTYLWRNPQANIGDPNSPGNKNAFIHTDRERFPFNSTVLAMYIARWVSLLFGVWTVGATFWLAHDTNPRWAAPAAVTVAFLPQFLFLSGACTNDTAIAATATTGLVFLLRVTRGQVTWRNLLGLGVSVGLALLAKGAGVLLLSLALYVTGALAAARKLARHQWMIVFGVVLLSAAGLAGWWYLRNWQLYGELTGQGAILLALGGRTRLPTSWGDIIGEFRGLIMSFWGLFGWFSILLPHSVYIALAFVTVAALSGLIARTARRRWEAAMLPSLLLLTAWTGLVLAGLVVWTLKASASQGRLMFPAVGAVAVLLVAGLEAFFPHGLGRWLMPGLFFVIAILVPPFVIQPAYARPPALALSQIPGDASRVHLRYGQGLELVAVRLGASHLKAGETLDVTLYWRALRPIASNYMIYLRLLGYELTPIAVENSYPGWGAWPTSLWRAGEIYADRYKLPVDSDAVAPTLARVIVLADDGVQPDLLPIFDQSGAPVDAFTPLAILGLRSAFPPPPLAHAQSAVFGDFAQLVGYDLEGQPAAPGDTLRLHLMWKAVAQPEAEYTVFVHLLDPEGRLVSGNDSPPSAGFYPTPAWQVGETFVETRSLTLPAALAPGAYRLEIGWYGSGDLQRVMITDASGAQIGDALLLNTPLHVSTNPE